MDEPTKGLDLIPMNLELPRQTQGMSESRLLTWQAEHGIDDEQMLGLYNAAQKYKEAKWKRSLDQLIAGPLKKEGAGNLRAFNTILKEVSDELKPENMPQNEKDRRETLVRLFRTHFPDKIEGFSDERWKTHFDLEYMEAEVVKRYILEMCGEEEKDYWVGHGFHEFEDWHRDPMGALEHELAMVIDSSWFYRQTRWQNPRWLHEDEITFMSSTFRDDLLPYTRRPGPLLPATPLPIGDLYVVVSLFKEGHLPSQGLTTKYCNWLTDFAYYEGDLCQPYYLLASQTCRDDWFKVDSVGEMLDEDAWDEERERERARIWQDHMSDVRDHVTWRPYRGHEDDEFWEVVEEVGNNTIPDHLLAEYAKYDALEPEDMFNDEDPENLTLEEMNVRAPNLYTDRERFGWKRATMWGKERGEYGWKRPMERCHHCDRKFKDADEIRCYWCKEDRQYIEEGNMDVEKTDMHLSVGNLNFLWRNSSASILDWVQKDPMHHAGVYESSTPYRWLRSEDPHLNQLPSQHMYIYYCLDRPGMEKVRRRFRDEHLDWAKDSMNIHMGGPLQSTDVESKPEDWMSYGALPDRLHRKTVFGAYFDVEPNPPEYISAFDEYDQPKMQKGLVGTFFIVNGYDVESTMEWSREDPYQKAGLYDFVALLPMTAYGLDLPTGVSYEDMQGQIEKGAHLAREADEFPGRNEYGTGDILADEYYRNRTEKWRYFGEGMKKRMYQTMGTGYAQEERQDAVDVSWWVKQNWGGWFDEHKLTFDEFPDKSILKHECKEERNELPPEAVEATRKYLGWKRTGYRDFAKRKNLVYGSLTYAAENMAQVSTVGEKHGFFGDKLIRYRLERKAKDEEYRERMLKIDHELVNLSEEDKVRFQRIADGLPGDPDDMERITEETEFQWEDEDDFDEEVIADRDEDEEAESEGFFEQGEPQVDGQGGEDLEFD